jgi:hypothetical protein
MTDPEPAIQIDAANVLDGVGTITPTSETAPGTKKDAENVGHAVLKRLLLWVEKEAHILGADIESEVASILAKIRSKAKL